MVEVAGFSKKQRPGKSEPRRGEPHWGCSPGFALCQPDAVRDVEQKSPWSGILTSMFRDRMHPAHPVDAPLIKAATDRGDHRGRQAPPG